jgi:hypothetical protein
MCELKEGEGIFTTSTLTSVSFYDSFGYGVADCTEGPQTQGKI